MITNILNSNISAFISSIILIIIIICFLITYSKTEDILNSFLIALTFAILVLTLYNIVQTDKIEDLTSNDIPNYPFQGYEIIPQNIDNYIDTRQSNSVIYEIDYTIRYSKLNPPESYDFTMTLPMETMEFIHIRDSRGMLINYTYNQQNKAIHIKNEDKTNPLLVYVIYASEEYIFSDYFIKEVPLPDIEKNTDKSFYVKIENTKFYHIKTFKLQSNVTQWINNNLTYLKNVSWANQTILIYDGYLPVEKTIVDDNGMMEWEINSINPGENKVYYFKILNSTYEDG